MALIAPYGGRLVDLLARQEEAAELLARASALPSIQISARALCDLELLATGAFSPLDRFLSRSDYEPVVAEMRLASGVLFPIPVTLPAGASDAIRPDREIALRSAKNDIVAIMRVEEIYRPDRAFEAKQVLGTNDPRHPTAAEMQSWGEINISGPLRVLRLPPPQDFRELRRTPAEVRRELESRGRDNVVAFQTRNPMHRAHEELTKRAIAATDGVLLLHPAVGMTRPGDIDHYTRVRTYKELVENYFPRDRVLLALLPLAMRMAGPREALWHAIIRRNYGANFFITGRDHASPGPGFYGPYDAHEMFGRHADEIGVRVIRSEELVYVVGEDRYEEASKVPAGAATRTISGTQVRDDYLAKGVPLPSWFTRPEVAAILAERHPPRTRHGFCVWFTGLPAAGKSSTAEALVALLLERGRQSTLLDGDIVRTHLSKGLGFSREDRDTNILRIGFVASEIARHSGAVVCAAVSPYRAARDAVRAMFAPGHFIEIFVDTPLEVCESRDPKGMYAQARRGAIRDFTGVSDPYEPPLSPELTLETQRSGAGDNARRIVEFLASRGFLAS
ncbi:MAG TPA: bifunctional sulfate adenylyltransferase/adenylylsulfate kinase [Thermoanaerobaculia bacterium]|nr:bifunctional sulfate adenylyltransferase/adenylylsulfate kinase [Thermoanaerobaculia bacterium]